MTIWQQVTCPQMCSAPLQGDDGWTVVSASSHQRHTRPLADATDEQAHMLQLSVCLALHDSACLCTLAKACDCYA